MRSWTRIASIGVLSSMLLFSTHAVPTNATARGAGGPDDAVVVAVLDFGFVPYHWDFLASKMPQARDADPSNDVPLDRPPHEWLPGFPQPQHAFESYSPVDLTLERRDPTTPVAELVNSDKGKWEKVKTSSSAEIHYYWFPRTKIIGAIDFGTGNIHGAPNDHGTGTTSVSVGNIHGTCPECLLFFIDLRGASIEESEAAINWAMAQPWIDAITNSYGFSLGVRDRLYSGSDVVAQKDATLRGQSIFFSAGNGQEGAFVVPNTTYFSSQEGPDWIITVGAVSPGEDNYYQSSTPRTNTHASYSGHGKAADIASIGSRYPSAYTATEVGGTGPSGFGGTSNATPTIAGLYARALYMARRALPGPSRVQRDGLIAVGSPFECGAKIRDCELRDGRLTIDELRTRLFHGAMHTSAGMTLAGYGELPPVGEDEFLNEGHGSYFGREAGPASKAWLEEFDRIIAPLEGRAQPLERPAGEREWMIVDSFCRQSLWGNWRAGYYVEEKTELPPDDPRAPLRTFIKHTCPYLFPPV